MEQLYAHRWFDRPELQTQGIGTPEGGCMSNISVLAFKAVARCRQNE
jgi:hypothetical protein